MANTIGTGGSIERELVKRWARRQSTYVKGAEDRYRQGVLATLSALIDWLKEQPKRTARKGGLGKR